MKTNPRPRACRLTNNLSFASNISITCATYVNIVCRYISTLIRSSFSSWRRSRDQFFSNNKCKKVKKNPYATLLFYVRVRCTIWIFFFSRFVLFFFFFFLLIENSYEFDFSCSFSPPADGFRRQIFSKDASYAFLAVLQLFLFIYRKFIISRVYEFDF